MAWLLIEKCTYFLMIFKNFYSVNIIIVDISSSKSSFFADLSSQFMLNLISGFFFFSFCQMSKMIQIVCHSIMCVQIAQDKLVETKTFNNNKVCMCVKARDWGTENTRLTSVQYMFKQNSRKLQQNCKNT